VKSAFAEANAAFLVADFTQKDPAIAEELKRRGRAGVPMYLWYPAGEREPVILPELLTQELVIGLVEGR
jgi:thiol:disulfide interchange protein DsbD